ncbi:uncharacterized protein LOC122244448 [Penaeus japonicus]|uniref:uncharacterized protein LOC122244448 n=1 Tax=Penaeus japonicus TaxID=27405 RepID=UPI001C710A98|nr:uncharacterized protein LOC122244448 [Penaeus japonicus]
MAAGITKQLLYLLVVCMVALGFMAMRSQIQEIRDAVHENGRSDAGGKVSIVERSLNRTKQLIDNIYCSIADVLPSGGFCLTDKHIFTGHNEAWDGKLCGALEDLFGYASVADFGAGLGHYGRCFLRHSDNLIQHENRVEQLRMSTSYKSEMLKAGLLNTPQVVKSWHGWDGAVNIGALSKGKIEPLDLADPVDLQRRFDWVMSIEVGEHIPAKAEDVFMDNLVTHACKGVVLSWAVPGQGGHNHVNTRSNDYIKSKMADKGLVADEDSQNRIRQAVNISWFKDTIMVFRFPKERC